MTEQPPEPSQPPQMSLTGMLLLQGGIVLLALVLDMAFGLRMLDGLTFSLSALNWGIAATIPLLLGVWLLGSMRWAWVAELQQFMLEIIVPLFRKTPAGALFAVALLAGVGEELLFRGVVQGGLEGIVGSGMALLLASLFFGAMHALSRAYFLVATAMGFYLGWLYLATGNLLIPIVVHFLYDWIVLRYYLKGR